MNELDFEEEEETEGKNATAVTGERVAALQTGRLPSATGSQTATAPLPTPMTAAEDDDGDDDDDGGDDDDDDDEEAPAPPAPPPAAAEEETEV